MRIIQRKNKYYYLQHSFRKKDKVITKEKYLGKKIPKNIEDIKSKMLKEIDNVYKKLEKIKEKFQEEWNKYPESIKEKEKGEIALVFTYNTNAIEGSTITLRETREIIQENFSVHKPLRDIKETESHYKIFLEMLNKKEEMNKELILKWHYEIFKESKEDIAGKFRDYLVRVGEYRAPDWQDIEKLIKEFIEFLKKSKLNPVELSARAHFKFEKMHPFGDGNGRIGRILMNYILCHNKYPMIIIEYGKRKSYYRALEKDEDKFVKYFFKRYLSIHKRLVF